jgi:CheY-like chemotaxis protein
MVREAKVPERAETILLVEDDENDVLLIQRAFRKAGIGNPLRVLGDGDVAVAYLGGEGLYADRLEWPLPGLLLLDLKLPRRSGLEVLAWLRQQPGIGRLVTVVLTSSRESADVNRAYELGANSYLVKPVLLDDLVQMVKTLDLYWLMINEKPDLRSA